MIIFILIGSIYFILLDFLSFIFSITSLCGILSSTSSNFECGFYPILTSYLRYRFNYWLILIHFLISEQELILALLFLFGLNSKTCFYCWIILSLMNKLLNKLEVFLIEDVLLRYYYSMCKSGRSNRCFRSGRSCVR